MKKSEQIKINKKVQMAIDDFNSQSLGAYDYKKLRTCNAAVFRRSHYWVLISYNTIVALIDSETDTLYDFLRLVYGYTATSAQHISKFNRDYCSDKRRCAHSYTYREV